MPSTRIRGQEVSIIVVSDGIVEDELTDIQDFNLEIESEVKVQGYLGEKNNRKDDIFNGVKGDMTLHLHSDAAFRFMQRVLRRQRRETPDVVFNVSAVLAFSNGQTPSILLPDVKFGSFPYSIPGRGEYVSLKLAFEADNFEFAATG